MRGQALLYRGETQNVLARTLERYQADGYTVSDQTETGARLTREGVTLELTVRQVLGFTVISVARLPQASAAQSGPASTDSAAPAAAPATTQPAPAAAPTTTEPAPATPPGDTTTPAPPPAEPAPPPSNP